MKNTKRLLSILLAVALVFALAVPSFALSDTSASYTQEPLVDAPTIAGEFTVYLSIDSSFISNNYTDDEYVIQRYKLPVTMGAESAEETYTVVEVLVEAMDQYPALSFTNSSGVEITTSSDYVYGISDSTVDSTIVFHPMTGINDYNGWMFRIDGKYPLLNPANYPAGWTFEEDGPLGAAIDQAYLKPQTGGNIQTIHLYYADTSSSTSATKTTCVDSAIYDSSAKTLTVTFYQSNSWFNNSTYYWNIYDYSPLASSSIWFNIDGGSTKFKTTDANGQVTLTNLTLPSGSHTIEIEPNYNPYIVGYMTYSFPKVLGLEQYEFTVN